MTIVAAVLGAAAPVLPTALLLWGCDPPEEEASPTAARAGEPPPAELPESAEPEAAEVAEVADVEVAGVEEVDEDEADEADGPAPIGVRVSTRTTLVYAVPRAGSDYRGRIDPDTPFAIYGMVQGTGCAGEGWAMAGPRPEDGYVCLKAATASDAIPSILPVLPEGLNVPYIYAKPKHDRKGNLLVEVPRYRNKLALQYDKEPLDFMAPHRNYAFVAVHKLPRHGKVLEDALEQMVPAKDMKLEEPSLFAGRVLADRPVTAGRVAAWAVSHETLLRAQPKMKLGPVGQLEYHTAIEVLPELKRGGGGVWLEIPDGLGPGVPAFVEASKVRRWEPGPELAGVGDDELWLDVDVGQQVLAVMRGQQPIFLTLVSSGTGAKPNTSTPRGTYRIRNKVALGAMRNRPEDADESPYHVEAVPWVMYFDGRFALHGAYWHNGFGHRKSHGCVNLAPSDARYVYGLVAPDVPPGWISSYEHAGEPGSVVRVRKGQEVGEDKRTAHEQPAPEAVLAEAAGP
ncbi:MAG: L,D-transpeptidase [Myxococcales bacterium]|nr:L,D-transpeptidase [Myxococcales bacterium]